jgi:hypothetical protein
VEVEFTRALQSESLSSGGTRNHHHSWSYIKRVVLKMIHGR